MSCCSLYRTPIHTCENMYWSPLGEQREKQPSVLPLRLRRVEGFAPERVLHLNVVSQTTAQVASVGICIQRGCSALVRMTVRTWQQAVDLKRQFEETNCLLQTLTHKPFNNANRESMNWLRCTVARKKERDQREIQSLSNVQKQTPYASLVTLFN